MLKDTEETYDALYKRFEFLGTSVAVLLSAHPEFWKQIFTTTTWQVIETHTNVQIDGSVEIGSTALTCVARELNIDIHQARGVVNALGRVIGK